MAAQPPTDYAATLSFLLSQVGARVAQLFAEHLEPLGVTPRAFGVLSNLVAAEGQTQQRLADALGIHRNNMVGLIDELESGGLVLRHRSAADRRAFEIRLTAAGHDAVARVGAVIAELEREVGRDLSAAERGRLIELLQRVAATLELRPGLHPHLSARRRSGTTT